MLAGSRKRSTLLCLGTASLFLTSSLIAQSSESSPDPMRIASAGDPAISDSDHASLRAVFQASRHAAVSDADGYLAHNPGQSWQTRFDRRGFTTTPDRGGWTWGFELLGYGYEGQIQPVAHTRATSAEGGRVTYEWDEQLTEWFINDERGLEHGYTVHARPRRGAQLGSSPLVLELDVRGDLKPRVVDDGRSLSFVGSSGTQVLNYSGLTVFDAEGTEWPASFRLEGERVILSVDESEATYPLTIDPIAQQAYIKASNTDDFDNFAWSMDASGDTVVIGAPWEDSSFGGVNGNQIDNGAFDSGAAYVFVRSGSTWTQQAYLKAAFPGSSDNFGTYVSIDGDTIAVGAPGEDSSATGVDGNQLSNAAPGSGAVYVYVRNGTNWSPQAYLKASNTEAGDAFAYTSVSGDLIAVCAELEDSNATGVNGNQNNNADTDSGAVYVFSRTGTTWSQEAYIKASNTDPGDLFGANSLDGETLVVCARGEDSSNSGINTPQSNNLFLEAGAAYVFERSGTTWSQTTYVKPSNTGTGDFFGISVSLCGDTFVVGANGEDSLATGIGGDQLNNSFSNAGAVYAFTRDGSTWVQDAYIKASNSGLGDQFGYSVKLSKRGLLVGAWEEDSASTGVGSDGSNNSAPTAGAAYYYQHLSGLWSFQAYIKASNAEAFDNFGLSVALSEEFAVVGASNEDSGSSGINGGQGNGGDRSGAAYVIDLTDTDSGDPFCAGDGSGGSCTCFNFGAANAGCANSETQGAKLIGVGIPDSLSDSFALIVTDSLPGKPGIIFQGNVVVNGGLGNPVGNGLLCVTPTKRWDVAFADAEGTVVYGPQLFSSHPDVMTLALIHYQWWYRDADDSCGGEFNFSNGWSVTWQ